MPIYAYEAKDGSRIEEFHPIESYPKRVKRSGKWYSIRVSGNSVRVPVYNHIAGSLPRWCPGAKKYVTSGPPEEIGKPIIESESDIKNVEAATNGRYRYNRDWFHDADIRSEYRAGRS